MTEWKFFGRHEQLAQLRKIFSRERWFFVKIAGRRRIGKTALVQKSLEGCSSPVFYVQIPDSDETGVVSAVNDALDTFEVPTDRFPRPQNIGGLVTTIESMAEEGYIIVLDEFQYFSRKPFTEFCSLLQAAVDRLSAKNTSIPGGLVVLGSLHTEMMAILEDRSAPLFGRVTDSIDLPHLDLSGVLGILNTYADTSPDRLLFLWTLFEGVPKYYRDAYEEDVLAGERSEVLRKLFFESSSPLCTEADVWFLRELRGRNDMVLKFVARHPGEQQRSLQERIREASKESIEQISYILNTLQDKYRLIERKQPILSKPNARRGRYYVTDNFLQAWLAALANQVAARQFRPVEKLIEDSNNRLKDVEGFGLEKLVGTLYEERSRKDLQGFSLTSRVVGFWDRGNIEIDLVALNEGDRIIRFGSCKRSPRSLLSDTTNFKGHVERFLKVKPQYQDWTIEHVGIAPSLNEDQRKVLQRQGVIPQDLCDLTQDLLAQD